MANCNFNRAPRYIKYWTILKEFTVKNLKPFSNDAVIACKNNSKFHSKNTC
jgi:hypothetical protein